MMGRVVGGPAGSGALAWPQRECLHQLVHGPETGEATGSCSLADFFPFFFQLRSTVLRYEWPGR